MKKFSTPFMVKSPLKNNHYKTGEYVKHGDGKMIEGEEISAEEFFHKGPYDYKTTQNYKTEMRRITDSLTGTGDIPRGLKEKVKYYSGPHREHNYLFPAEGKGLASWAAMPASERKKYFESKGIKPSFPVK
jgi:hypothetical protein